MLSLVFVLVLVFVFVFVLVLVLVLVFVLVFVFVFASFLPVSDRFLSIRIDFYRYGPGTGRIP